MTQYWKTLEQSYLEVVKLVIFMLGRSWKTALSCSYKPYSNVCMCVSIQCSHQTRQPLAALWRWTGELISSEQFTTCLPETCSASMPTFALTRFFTLATAVTSSMLSKEPSQPRWSTVSSFVFP